MSYPKRLKQMGSFLFLFALAFVSWAAATSEAWAAESRTDREARAKVKKLVALVREGRKFRYAGCAPFPREKLGLLLLNQAVVHEVRFTQGCDLQGKLTVTRAPFPVDFEVRNLPGVARVKGTLALDFRPDPATSEVLISAKATQGLLFQGFRDQLMSFGGDYAISLGMDGIVKKNKGGKIQVKQYRGAFTAVTEPLRIE